LVRVRYDETVPEERYVDVPEFCGDPRQILFHAPALPEIRVGPDVPEDDPNVDPAPVVDPLSRRRHEDPMKPPESPQQGLLELDLGPPIGGFLAGEVFLRDEADLPHPDGPLVILPSLVQLNPSPLELEDFRDVLGVRRNPTRGQPPQDEPAEEDSPPTPEPGLDIPKRAGTPNARHNAEN
jgi:hypothetical protein